MKVVEYPDRLEWLELLKRPADLSRDREEQVRVMLADMKSRGWDAVMEMAAKFDEPYNHQELTDLDGITIHSALVEAIRVAIENITRFHEKQRRGEIRTMVTPGVECWQRWLPIDRVGLYVPGGTAPLISTVLMLGIPARLAGCREVVLCTPPDRKGNIHPAILYAAVQCGISQIFPLGGVQAIGAMAYGLGEVPKVDKIFGPGNSWVTMAKQLVGQEGVAIDMPAGPSEVAIMADDTCDPAFVAADLLSQAEHGVDSQCILVTTQPEVARQVVAEVKRQIESLPRRDIALHALQSSAAFVLENDREMIGLINEYAPEHLIIATKSPGNLSDQIVNAGSVFLGNWSPESAGDYASGTNHTLPTSGYARAYSGLTMDSYMKSITYQELTPHGIASIAPAIVELARAEGLEAHARSAEMRAERQESGVSDKSGQVGRWVRRNILNVKPYSSARDEYSGTGSILLDANENPIDNGMNRYPDPLQKKLRERPGYCAALR